MMDTTMTEQLSFVLEREKIFSMLPDPNRYEKNEYCIVYQTNIERHNIPKFAYFMDLNFNLKEHLVGLESAKEVTYLYFHFIKKREVIITQGLPDIKYKWELENYNERKELY